MQMLESAMAFAVVMILLSTIVTGIVEALLRLLYLRQETLKQTMGALFDSVIWPRIEKKLEEVSEDTDKPRARDSFVDAMTLNPVLAQPQHSDPAAGTSGSGEWWLFRKRRVDVLSIIAFAERLGRTDVGQAILEESKDTIDPLIKDFTRSFERFGRAAGEVFRTKAKLTAIGVGIILAFAANIDAGRLFTTLMENPDLRTGLIEQGDDAAEANREAARRLEQIVEQLGKAELSAEQTKEIEQRIQETRTGIARLSDQGLPIGYSYYPYCLDGGAGDAACSDTSDAGPGSLARWAVLTVTAGVLMGLGGPFWYRVFSSLSQLFQVLRAVGIGSKTQQAKPEEVTAPPEVEDSVKPTSVLDAFLVAANGRRQAEGKPPVTLPSKDPQSQSSPDPDTQRPDTQNQDTAAGGADASPQPA